MRERFGSYLRSRRGLILALVLVVAALSGLRGRSFVDAGSLEHSLAASLARDGLVVTDGSIQWAAPGSRSLGFRDVVFLAAYRGEPTDFYAARVRAAGTSVLDLDFVTNLSRTPGAAETSLRRSGDFVAYLNLARGRVEALTLVDLRGEPTTITSHWSRLARVQNAITNVQETSRPRGFGRRRYTIEPAADSAALAVRGERFVLALPDVELELDPARDEPVSHPERLALSPTDKGIPGGIGWIVDTVRALSFVGPEPIAWLENRVYGVRDRVQRLRYRVFGTSDDERDEAPHVSAEQRRRRLAAIAELGEIGFPPPPLDPIITPRAAGEGEWLALVDDPFVGSYPNAAPGFAETHLRADPERPYARIHLIVWDPRQIQLRAVSGTREPESANGAFGTGTIPRRRETLPRLVAAFNGGFQAMHGEFGMMADSTVYLPPKPFAATVGIMDDGQVVMGSWQGLPEGARSYTEAAAMAQIPEGMTDFRQNLTSVLEGTRINPWERWYWGAANINATEQTFVDRSALCVTREGFVIYFWGQAMGIEALGETMKRAHCERGMHLDMNSKYTAFELYDVRRVASPAGATGATQTFAPLGRALGEDEFESAYPGAPDFRVRGRIAMRQMEPVRVPRYLETDRRDFFYLELRPTLPGPNLADGTRFDVRSLPQSSYPWAFAKAETAGAILVRIDPLRAVPAPVDALARTHGTRRLGSLGAASLGPLALVARREGVTMRYEVTPNPGDAIVVLRGEALSGTPTATSAVGVDAEGFLVHAESNTPGAVARALAAAGVTDAVVLETPLRFELDGASVNARGEVLESAPGGVALLERAAPYTGVLNPEVQPMPYASWGRIQDTRVRYRPEPGPRRFNQGN